MIKQKKLTSSLILVLLLSIAMLSGCQWRVYTIKYNIGEYGTTEDKTVIRMKEGYIPNGPRIISKEGYSFKGWDKYIGYVDDNFTLNALYEKGEYYIENPKDIYYISNETGYVEIPKIYVKITDMATGEVNVFDAPSIIPENEYVYFQDGQIRRVDSALREFETEIVFRVDEQYEDYYSYEIAFTITVKLVPVSVGG